TKPLNYQWQKNGIDLPNQNGATLLLPAVRLADAGEYRVNVSNAGGSIPSQAAVLMVRPSAIPPEITVQPQSQTVDQGGIANFTVGATGTLPFLYQWQRDGMNIAGATTPVLALINVQSTEIGDYSVLISNAAGTVTSRSAALTLRLAG